MLTVDDKPLSEKDGAFAQLEKQKQVKHNISACQQRVAELEHVSADQWSDPYTVNANLRHTFRVKKDGRLKRELSDAALRERIGWSQDRIMAPPTSSEPGYTTPDIQRAWADAQIKKQRANIGKSSTSQHGLRFKSTKHMTPAAQNLARRVLSKSRTPRQR